MADYQRCVVLVQRYNVSSRLLAVWLWVVDASAELQVSHNSAPHYYIYIEICNIDCNYLYCGTFLLIKGYITS